MDWVIIIVLAFIQSIAHTMSSRSRNRSNMTYHAVCAVFSNGIFFLTLNVLVVSGMDVWLIIPYITGTVTGSLFGASISMKVEKLIGATT